MSDNKELRVIEYLNELIHRYPILQDSKEDILKAYFVLKEAFADNGKLLVAGNGGSAADAEHIAGELMKGFCLPRKVNDKFAMALKAVDDEMGAFLAESLQGALPTIALTNHNSLNTATINDIDGRICYAQQIMGYGEQGDVFLGISTSGNSQNVLYATVTAKAKGMKVIGLTGAGGGRLKNMVDVCICVNEKETYKIQELHLPIYHCLCLMLEYHFFESIDRG